MMPSELHRLHLEELLEPELAQLAAAPRLLEAAERSEGIEAAPVDVHLPGAQAAGDPLGAGGVGRPDAAGEPVHGIIRDPDRVVVVLVRQDGKPGAEDLLAGDGHRRLHAGEDRRLHVIALRQPGRSVWTAGRELRAFLDTGADVFAHAFALLRRGERSEPRLRRARIARLELRRLALRDLQRLSLLLAGNEHAGPGRAGLTGVEERVRDGDAHRLVEIGVVEDDGGGLPAQLKGEPL